MSFFKKAQLITFLIALFFISSCTVIETEYVFSDSKYEVTEKEFLLDFEKLEKQLPVRVSYPAGEGRFPIIIFSHGNGSEGSMYKGFTDKWASHGYVVIQPTHMDSSSLGFQMNRNSMREMYQQMLFVTDSRLVRTHVACRAAMLRQRGLRCGTVRAHCVNAKSPAMLDSVGHAMASALGR